MSIQTLVKDFIRVGFSTSDFYSVINGVYRQFYGEYLMLHYPLCRHRGEDLFRCQQNLTDYCLTKLPALLGKEVLEIGCGNGVQTGYILKKYNPASITGVDLSTANIAIAREQGTQGGKLTFVLDDAQQLSRIGDESIDIVVNIESAFHYPDKKSFLAQIHRVLKPGGFFLIADILNRADSGSQALSFWQRRMNLNHWTLGDYTTAFRDNDLQITYHEDITSLILYGYRHTRIWSRSFLDQSLLLALMGYLWGKSMAALNSLLLLTVRRYIIFTGVKREQE
jgi:SAM-dependent methyltransferase